MSQREDHDLIVRYTVVNRLFFSGLMTGAVTALSVAWNGSDVTLI